jgi:hypothetical protein
MGTQRYSSAQICLNGHLITDILSISPHQHEEHCHVCGKRTITACETCGSAIRGQELDGFYDDDYSPPSYCHNCGSAYPWTAAKLQAAKELAEELDDLTPDERDKLKGTLDDLVADTPRTALAATRFKKLTAKAGSAIAEGFRQILVDVVSESAKKMIWG